MANGGKWRFGAVHGQDRLDFGRNLLNLVGGRDSNHTPSEQPSSSGLGRTEYANLWPSVGGTNHGGAEAMAIDGFEDNDSSAAQISMDFGGSMESLTGRGGNYRNSAGTSLSMDSTPLKRSQSAGGSLGTASAPTYQPPPPPKKGILKTTTHYGQYGNNRYAPYPGQQQKPKKSIRFADMDDVQGADSGTGRGGSFSASFPTSGGDVEFGESSSTGAHEAGLGGGGATAAAVEGVSDDQELAKIRQELAKSVIGQLCGDGCMRSFTPFELDQAMPELCSSNRLTLVRLYGILHEVSEPLQQPPFKCYRVITIRDVAKNTLVRGICYGEFPGEIMRLAESAGNVFVRAVGRLTQDMHQVMLQILSVRAASQQEKQEFLAQSFSAL